MTTTTAWCGTGTTATATTCWKATRSPWTAAATVPSFVDAKNQFRAYGNLRNNWNIDREVQKTQTFTGIPGINQQDRAVQESMGPIVDRSREHLGPADRAIISARRILTNAVRAVERGETPEGVGPSYYSIRASEKIFPRDIPWREVMLPEMYPEGETPMVEAAVPGA